MNHLKIIIVGSTSGIGLRMAEMYVEKGHRVGLTGRRKHLLEKVKQQYPEQTEIECFDVTGGENIPRLESLVGKLGGLDLLVISAGTGQPSKELKWEIDKPIVNTNVNGFVEIANWAFNYFVKQGHGQLATISSIAANRGISWSPAYSASKAFQSIYFEGLAIKAQKLRNASGGTGAKIFTTCIEPGFVNTRMAHGGKNMFWIVTVEKAARQIIRALDKKKRKVYISRRWWLIARLMKWVPYPLFKKFA